MIFDTDVLIWYLRGNEKALEVVVEATPFSVSIVTYIELLQGMNNKHELQTLKKAFREMGVNIIPINESISLRAAELVETFGLSHSMEMADAIIASTCIEINAILFTANDKHYKMIKDLPIKVFRP